MYVQYIYEVSLLKGDSDCQVPHNSLSFSSLFLIRCMPSKSEEHIHKKVLPTSLKGSLKFQANYTSPIPFIIIIIKSWFNSLVLAGQFVALLWRLIIVQEKGLLVWSQHVLYTHLKVHLLMSNLLYRNWVRMLQSVYNISLKCWYIQFGNKWVLEPATGLISSVKGRLASQT